MLSVLNSLLTIVGLMILACTYFPLVGAYVNAFKQQNYVLSLAIVFARMVTLLWCYSQLLAVFGSPELLGKILIGIGFTATLGVVGHFWPNV